jgi:hypothetical protein
MTKRLPLPGYFDLGAALDVAPGDDHALDAAPRKKCRNRFTLPVGGTGDDDDFAILRKILAGVRVHGHTFTGFPVCQDIVAASASMPACKPSKPDGLGFRSPVSTALMNVLSSLV